MISISLNLEARPTRQPLNREETGMSRSNAPHALETVLVLEPDAFARARLVAAFRGSRWNLVTVETIEEIHERLWQDDYLAVLVGLGHGEAVQAAAARWGRHTKIIGMAEFREILDPETAPPWAFSLLHKPLAANEVIQTVNFAWAAARRQYLTLSS